MNAPAHARPPLLSLDEALERLLEAGRGHRILDTESIPTLQALGRTLAQDVRSSLDVPPADNTSMDGYALRAADVTAPGMRLKVSQRIPAGVVGSPLAAGTAARIFTGAQVPPGADAVVMQEQCEAQPAAAGVGLGGVRINAVPQPGQWIRRRGEDIRAGAVVLTAGTRLTPQAMGLAASVGCASLSVVRRPRVALFSTGDELAMPGDPLKPGAIYNSNRFTLTGLLQAVGCDVADLGIIPDRLDATRAALRDAAASCDLILTSGGVSVGEEDHLRPAVRAEGRIDLWQVAMKPGKPLALGAVQRGHRPDSGPQVEGDSEGEALFVGLPGNPVSSFVTFVLAVVPLLRAMQGRPFAAVQRRPVRADFDWPRPDRRREFLRVRLNESGGLDLFSNQSSGVLTSTVWADGLTDVPAGQVIAQGDLVQYLPLTGLLD
jgi:molybdopterin molybdotransferase